MDWKTDSGLNELDNEPYSSFQSNKSGKLFDRLELPIILIGAGLLALVILFVLFIPKKNEVTIDDYKHLVSRLDQLEDKIEVLSGTEIDIEEFDPANNPVQYQQVINWIKSNAEVISETIKKVDAIEKTINVSSSSKTTVSAAPVKEKAAGTKKKTASVSKSQPKTMPRSSTLAEPVEAPKPVTEPKPLEKSKPVKINQQKKTMPVIAEKPKDGTNAAVPAVPETKVTSKPVPPKQPITTVKPVTAKPDTYKFIFHRVEKGETLYRISVNNGISVQELQELNDMKKDDLIIDIGEELIVKKVKQ